MMIEAIDDERHPDDIAAQEQSEQEAAKAIDAWFEAHKAEMKATISTYPDGEAEDLWSHLRELFWASNPIGSDSIARPGRR